MAYLVEMFRSNVYKHDVYVWRNRKKTIDKQQKSYRNRNLFKQTQINKQTNNIIKHIWNIMEVTFNDPCF